jgi:predicted MFS family arabinose efflux permease
VAPDRSEGIAPPSGERYSTAYTRYALGLLCVVYVINFVDRQVLSILLQSIKDDLQLSDAQLGLLSGTAFGIFYATLGIPIARLADVFSRKWVITVSLSLWSAATVLCGTAASFGALLLYRIGVGVGEAGGSPPSHSLISDYYPPERRGTALGIFSLGVPLGVLVGLLAGGWLDEALGWRAAFLVVGLPGLALAVVVALTLREPPRGLADGSVAGEGDVSARDAIRFLWSLRSFRYTALGSAAYAFVGYSTVTWAPSFLMRSHGMESGPVGTWLALILGVGGAIGVTCGGVLSDRWAKRNPRGRVYVGALGVGLSLPFSIPVFLADSPGVALAWLCVPSTLGMMYQGPAFALTQTLATPKIRATAAALLLFVINIVGLACGPALTGVLSDALEPLYGADSLAAALLIVSFGLGISAFLFWWASRSLEDDLETSRRASAREAAGGSILAAD